MSILPTCRNGVSDFARICYFTDWAVYRAGKGQFTPANIDPKLCTHIVYAYASLNPENYTIVMSDQVTDMEKGKKNRPLQ